MRTLKFGSSGPDVEQLQQKLKELGHYTGAVDGRFGALTKNAVMNFQRARGLVVDGIAGPKTLAALGLGSSPAPTTQPVPHQPVSQPGSGMAISLHIGVNRVDPTKYAGWNGALSGCENDARTMTEIARTEGFTTTQLFSQQATSGAVLGEIANAAGRLGPAGIFLLTYAGHGGQVPNQSADPEEDRQDETWVLFDRQLIDDELEQAFTAFKPGVSIVMLSDSCHSGSVHRSMADPVQDAIANLKRSFYTGLGAPRPGPNEREPIFSFPRPVAALRATSPAVARQYLTVVGNGQGARGEAPILRFPGQDTRSSRGMDGNEAGTNGNAPGGGVQTREMPLDANRAANEAQAYVLDSARQAASGRGQVQATGLLISGCQDSQLSQEVGGNGVFTTAVNHVWGANTFGGSFEAFHRQVLSQMGPTQTPVLTAFGAPSDLLRRTPFNVPQSERVH
jgi:hypothetical protein